MAGMAGVGWGLWGRAPVGSTLKALRNVKGNMGSGGAPNFTSAASRTNAVGCRRGGGGGLGVAGRGGVRLGAPKNGNALLSGARCLVLPRREARVLQVPHALRLVAQAHVDGAGPV